MANIVLPHNWRPRLYQRNSWKYMQGNEEGKRALCVWHRRAGKDLTAINLIACKSQERVGTYWHVLPTYKQGRKIVWNGMTRDGRRFLDHIPKELIAGENATEMRINLRNGSIYEIVGSDNVDSLVGTNPIGVVFSEYSLQDPAAWNYVRPILAENGGWAIFIFTARGKNHAHKLLEMAKQNPKWFVEILVAGSGPGSTKREDGSPVISDEMIQEERVSGMPEELVQQEYYCSFEAPLVGAYYGQQMMLADGQGRISNVPHDPIMEVDTWWDLGVSDSTAIWFVQQYGMEVRIIDYYEASGEGLPHYAKILKEKPYVYNRHIAPHDIMVRELSSGKSRIETARDLGIRFTVCTKHTVMDGIDAVRNLIPLCWFDYKKCERGIEALRQYRKEWNEQTKAYSTSPLHDWTSHAADAFRIGAMGGKLEVRRRRKGPPQETAIDEHRYT